LCNDVQREGVKLSPDLAFGLFCYVPLHNFRYSIYNSSERESKSVRSTASLTERMLSFVSGKWQNVVSNHKLVNFEGRSRRSVCFVFKRDGKYQQRLENLQYFPYQVGKKRRDFEDLRVFFRCVFQRVENRKRGSAAYYNFSACLSRLWRSVKNVYNVNVNERLLSLFV
jgi:hypothetical protein